MRGRARTLLITGQRFICARSDLCVLLTGDLGAFIRFFAEATCFSDVLFMMNEAEVVSPVTSALWSSTACCAGHRSPPRGQCPAPESFWKISLLQLDYFAIFTISPLEEGGPGWGIPALLYQLSMRCVCSLGPGLGNRR